VSSLRFLSPALASWVRSLPSTGLFEPLGEGRFRLRVSQTRLAEELGYNGRSGALSRRLKRLESAGVLVSRRPLVLQLDGDETPEPRSSGAPSHRTARHAGVAARVTDPVTTGLVAGPAVADERTTLLWSLLDRCLDDRLEVLGSRVLDLLFALDLPDGADPSARESIIVSGDPARTDRASSRSIARNGQRGVRDLENSVQTAVYLSPATRAERTQRAIRADRTVPELRELVDPLLVECTARGLPGVSNAPGLLAALEKLDDDEVSRGVAFVVNQIRTGVEVRSPFGLLASLASRGSLS
jgi:hypothetical protein